jgi:hypothetical protein
MEGTTRLSVAALLQFVRRVLDAVDSKEQKPHDHTSPPFRAAAKVGREALVSAAAAGRVRIKLGDDERLSLAERGRGCSKTQQ